MKNAHILNMMRKRNHTGCQFYFDEDDIARASLYGDRYICPHFQYKDEYRIVRKQI